MTEDKATIAAVYAVAKKAVATGQCAIEHQGDVIKVLRLLRDYEAVRLIEALSEEDYGAIVAQAKGAPPRTTLTPKGGFIDPDEPPRRRGEPT